MERKLAAILAADVVGYSRLIEQDEAGTLAALKERRKDILAPLVAEHRGRIVKVIGDGVLVEFASAVNAVACAVELQERMALANASLLEDRHIVLRIGINLGDVIIEGNDLYGDGVNIAARLERMAEPGGILVSGTTYDHAKNKVNAAFEDLGTHALKNIVEPIRVYRVAGTPRVSVAAPGVATDKPSIAVLPFANMSGDSEQTYFADGITDDIITELARFRELSVSARASSFIYRDRSVNLQQVGRELGVQYLLEGSVRKLGDRVRITVQLVDATTGAHVWAERYDRDMQEVFGLQDEIVDTIVETLLGKIASTIAERAKRKPPSDWRAYDCYLMGAELYLTQTKESMTRAIEYFQKAVGIDPQYVRAFSGLCTSYGRIAMYFLKGDHDAYTKALASARENVLKALSIDGSDAVALEALGWTCMRARSFGEAEHLIDRAHRLNPHHGDIAMGYVTCLSWVGKPEQAIALAEAMIRRNPRHPDSYFFDLGEAHFFARHCEKAIDLFDRLPDQLLAENRGMVAAAYAHAGKMDPARRHADRYVEELRTCWVGDPAAGLSEYLAWEFQYRHIYKRPGDVEHVRKGLRKAGLP